MIDIERHFLEENLTPEKQFRLLTEKLFTLQIIIVWHLLYKTFYSLFSMI